jgi:hypothetical protein
VLKDLSRIYPVLSVLLIHIVNVRQEDAGVRMISEHRARFCMAIADMLQDRFPVVAAFCPIYDSLLKRHLTRAQTQGGTKVPHCPTTSSSMQNGPRQLNNEPGSVEPTEGSLDQVLPDSMGTLFPFSFPFGNLFEDILLSSPSQPALYGEDEISPLR